MIMTFIIVRLAIATLTAQATGFPNCSYPSITDLLSSICFYKLCEFARNGDTFCNGDLQHDRETSCTGTRVILSRSTEGGRAGGH